MQGFEPWLTPNLDPRVSMSCALPDSSIPLSGIWLVENCQRPALGPGIEPVQRMFYDRYYHSDSTIWTPE